MSLSVFSSLAEIHAYSFFSSEEDIMNVVYYFKC